MGALDETFARRARPGDDAPAAAKVRRAAVPGRLTTDGPAAGRGAASGVFLAALGFFLLTHGGHFYAADTLIVHLTAKSLLTEGNLALGEIWGAVLGADGQRYGRYGIGLSLLQMPLVLLGEGADALFPRGFAWLAGRGVSIYYPENFTIYAASLVGPLCGALAAATLWSLAAALGHPRYVVALLTGLLVVATQTWPASRDGFPHVVVLLLVLVAARAAITWSRPVWSAAAVGGALGMMLLVRPFDAVVTAPVVLAWLLAFRARGDLAAGVLGRNVVALALPLALAAALVAWHNHLRFGGALLFDEPGTQVFNTPFATGAHGLLLSSGRGLLVYSPPLLAGLCGLPLLARRRPADAALLAGLALALLAGYATYAHWDGGICWGGRYLVPLIPLLLLPAGELLARRGPAMALTLCLGIAGVLVQIAGTAVDFHRVAHDVQFGPHVLLEPAHSPIRTHWRFLLEGRHLDWLPLRIRATRGLAVAIAYALPGLLLLAAGLARVARAGSNPAARRAPAARLRAGDD